MRNRILAAGCAAIVLAAGTAMAGTTYYVSPTGTDGPLHGTIYDPWKTIGYVNSQSFDPGDTILFEADGVWMEQLVIRDSGNSEGSGGPITFGMYGSGNRPVIGHDGDLTGATWEQIAGTDAWKTTQTTEVELMSEWVPYSAQHVAAGFSRLYHEASDQDEVENTAGSWWWDSATDKLYIHMFDDANPNTAGHGFWINTRGWGDSDGSVDIRFVAYVVVQDLHLVCGGSGVYIQDANNILVDDCRFSGNRSGTNSKAVSTTTEQLIVSNNDARYNGNGYKFGKTTDITLSGNKAYYTLVEHCCEDQEGAGFNTCDDIKVFDKEFTDIASAAIQVYSAPEEVTTDVYIHHNYLFGYCDKGIAFGTDGGLYDGDLHIYHNVLWLDLDNVTSKGIYLRSATKVTSGSRPSYQIWNNTIRADYGLVLRDLAQNPNHQRIDHVLQNNVFEYCSRHIFDHEDNWDNGNANFDRNFNCYYPFGEDNRLYYAGDLYDGTENQTFSDYQDRTEQYDSVTGTDEQLTNPPTSYYPDENEECADAGTDPPGDVPYDPDTDLDFYGNAIGTPSIGAAEPPTP